MFKGFTLAKYKLKIKAEERLYLPMYMGSTLRGGFGTAFRRIVCFNRENICQDCILREKCVYSYIFETSPPKDSKNLKKNNDIPRPFIIEPPLNEKREYNEGEILEFGFTLIGKAIEYLPYFIVTFKELGSIGLGKGRGRYSLEGMSIDGDEIYSSDGILRETQKRINEDEIIAEAGTYPKDRLTIEFITPTRMKYNERCINLPEFHVLIRSLLSRISSLSYFHCHEELSLDYKGIIERAERVKIKENQTEWYDWERYSSRQDTKMNLGGIVGKVTYQGNMEEFLPLIALGSYVHAGKGATFGLGKYEVWKD
ncbi:CRISPR system precrRNA processing endoribonuclease RAMP protein Cas6 [bacterium]|nr:CRISPR system precrRNA processing endoribonuclease RAMP protein Cas6 [bacterium]